MPGEAGKVVEVKGRKIRVLFEDGAEKDVAPKALYLCELKTPNYPDNNGKKDSDSENDGEEDFDTENDGEEDFDTDDDGDFKFK